MSANPEDLNAFDLKGSSFTLPVLHLLKTDMEAVSRQLSEKVEQAPDFFNNAPMVIDLQSLREPGTDVDFALLIGLLRGHGLIPIGVRGGNDEQSAMASAMELAILGEGRPERPKPEKPADPTPKAEPKPVLVAAQSTLVDKPVRSGQRVYAKGGDLIATAPVSAGAEVIADGNIHIYGVLRGRALAGVNGNLQSRIFCRGLDADLISIAGTWKVAEDIGDAYRNTPVQIYLEGNSLQIVEL